jgi:hypothetical protein
MMARSGGKRASGGFLSWLNHMRAALAGEADADVPCGGCRACCDSSHFVHVRPGETGTISVIPAELLFSAPGEPDGCFVMGYDERGRCPMLAKDGCSIYEQRPWTCRTYDCRVFAAAGVAADREAITRRAECWVFEYPSQADRDAHVAVGAAARFAQNHAECFPGAAVPGDPAQVAVLAVVAYEVFLDGSAVAGDAREGREIARAIMAVSERFGAGQLVEGPLINARRSFSDA